MQFADRLARRLAEATHDPGVELLVELGERGGVDCMRRNRHLVNQ